MKAPNLKWLMLFWAGIFLLGWLFYYGHGWKQRMTSQPVAGVESNSPATNLDAEKSQLFPFAIDMAKAEHDPYFGPAVPYDPNDPMMADLQKWMQDFAKAMDNPKHPCNPLVTTNAKIIGINIKPLRNGDTRYTMWVSDGKTICGMEGVHYTDWSGVVFKGNFFQRFYVREMAAGFYYPNKDMIDEVIAPDKKRFWKQDVGEAAHDMVVEAFGQDFLDNTIPQEYSGFFVADALNVVYLSNGFSHNVFTKNVVDASLRRTDLLEANLFDYANNKFNIYIQAEPSNSPLAFKVVYANAFNNGLYPSNDKSLKQKNAVRFR